MEVAFQEGLKHDRRPLLPCFTPVSQRRMLEQLLLHVDLTCGWYDSNGGR